MYLSTVSGISGCEGFPNSGLRGTEGGDGTSHTSVELCGRLQVTARLNPHFSTVCMSWNCCIVFSVVGVCKLYVDILFALIFAYMVFLYLLQLIHSYTDC